MKKNNTNKIKKRFGDRYDGRRVRHSDPTNVIIPFIMKTRNDAQVEFDAEIDVSNIEERIRERRKNGETISFLDYFFTALIRTVAEYPRLNRFIAGRRLYSRDDLSLSIVVKKEMNIETEATPIKMIFEKDSSVDDVAELLQKTINANKGGTGIKNDTDKLMNVLNRLPRFLFSFVIDFLTFLDFYGHMPKFIHRISPFHTSMFVTNMGSIGSGPIYHHIYNWGTTSIFIAMGTKKKLRVIDKNGKIVEKKVMKLRFVADERIGDGFYLSKALKYFTGLFLHPEILEQKAERVLEDDQI
ncbi:MAG: 2-oxo acid dehydrogenase subunit E2 [Clostridia bacterium]|nr:2-oxo acid dehydrogenase subunit E2 [Clostridia bacterium]